VASLALSLLEHLALHGTTDSNLHNETGTAGELPCLNGNLFREFTGGRDDDGPDIVGLCALVSTNLLAELGIGCDDALDDGNEETKGFTSTSLCLRDTAFDQLVYSFAKIDDVLHVDATEGLVDGPLLHIRHSLNLHLLGDGVDDVGVHEATGSELCEGSRWSILSKSLLCLDLLCNLLPLGAVVEAG
jgi:hypothetical protein